MVFLKKCKSNISLLKAPSRHKKFFHQLTTEFFICRVFFKFKNTNLVDLQQCCSIFKQLERGFFKKIGSNILARTKILITIPTKKQQ